MQRDRLQDWNHILTQLQLDLVSLQNIENSPGCNFYLYGIPQVMLQVEQKLKALLLIQVFQRIF